MRKTALGICSVLLLASPTLARDPALTDPQIDARVNDLLSRMTVEEKVGQLIQLAGRHHDTGPQADQSDPMVLAAAGQLGAMLNVTGARDTNEFQRAAVERSRMKIPLIFGLDVIHGYRTTFPVPLGLAATWNPQLAQRTARAAAVEATSEGIRWTFSPMVDIARDPRWGRVAEGAGEDPYLGSAMAQAYVRGYQGERIDAPTSMIACAKHFAAYGAAEAGRDYNTTDMSDRALREVYLPPFKACVDAGAMSFMSAFNALQGVPASANHRLLTDILRQEWGFRGFVVSDWTAVLELVEHGVATDGAAAARAAISAGVDMDMVSRVYATLVEQVRSGAVPEATIDEAARRILRVKFAMGLFERPYSDESAAKITALDPAHLQLAREAAEQSIVLLKNDPTTDGKPLLPLPAGRTIALVGPLADSAADMLGTWRGKGDAKDVVTLAAEFRSRSPHQIARLIVAKGTDIRGETEGGFDDAIHAAKAGDIVVMALGESENMTGEAASRANIDLPGNQRKLLQAIVATGKPIVLVMFSGRPLALTWETEHAPAIVQAWFPGVQAGPAVARVLFGDVNPSGKLPVTFPRSLGQVPIYHSRLNTGRPVDQDPNDHFRSRYSDEKNEPLFPFGWGLSYTNFEYGRPTISKTTASAKELNAGATMTVEAEVKNVGDREGTEIAQLYIRQRGTSISRPVRELKGFRRVTLKPGQSRRVEFTLGKRELAFWNIDMRFIVEPAELTVWIGPNSDQGNEARIKIEP